MPSDATELSFGNSVYKVRFDQREERPLYGFRYHFYLKDAVEDVPEYVVNWENFVKYVSFFGLLLAQLLIFKLAGSLPNMTLT